MGIEELFLPFREELLKIAIKHSAYNNTFANFAASADDALTMNSLYPMAWQKSQVLKINLGFYASNFYCVVGSIEVLRVCDHT